MMLLVCGKRKKYLCQKLSIAEDKISIYDPTLAMPTMDIYVSK